MPDSLSLSVVSPLSVYLSSSLSLCLFSVLLASPIIVSVFEQHLYNLPRWEDWGYLWALPTSFFLTQEFILTQHSNLTTSPYIVSLSHLNEFVNSASLVFVLWSGSLIPIEWCQCVGLLGQSLSACFTTITTLWKFFLLLSFVLNFLLVVLLICCMAPALWTSVSSGFAPQGTRPRHMTMGSAEVGLFFWLVIVVDDFLDWLVCHWVFSVTFLCNLYKILTSWHL